RDRVILSLKAARTQLADAVSSIDLVELSGDELHVQVVKRPETSWANTEIEAALRGLIERRMPEVIQVEVAFEETAEAEPRLLSSVLGRSRRRTNKWARLVHATPGAPREGPGSWHRKHLSRRRRLWIGARRAFGARAAASAGDRHRLWAPEPAPGLRAHEPT